MAEKRKRSQDLCKKCAYSKNFTGKTVHCDYITMEGHSRIFDSTGRIKDFVKEGFCDVYVAKKSKKSKISA